MEFSNELNVIWQNMMLVAVHIFLLEEYCREDSFSRPRREHLRDQSYMNIVWSLKESKQTKPTTAPDALALLEASPCSVWVTMDKLGKAGTLQRKRDEGLGGRQGTALSDSDSNLAL